MLSPHRVYMLAADHRWQWEEFCDARSIPRERISEVKRVAYRGFVLASERSSAVRAHGALLLDQQYASDVIDDAVRAGFTVGTPAEKAGAVPLDWATDPFSRALTGSFVKVLVRYRADDDAAVCDGQWAKLDALQGWCRAAGKPLVIEVLVARKQEPEAAFDASGRPTMIAGFISEAYRRGVTPEFWKIEGTLSPDGARVIDAAIAERPACRQILLGKAADLSTIDRWFAAASRSGSAVGFAIGRSVFWQPAAAFLTAEKAPDQAAADIAANYLALVDSWDTWHRSRV